ncbi:MAG: hypothetical protein NT011_08605 [Kiritimatiellaeota bacterium]|nr:hypothetical protein [Kiritimatiellota bacterium]
MKTEHLPNALQAQVTREKVVDYLLCTEHPDGGSKARFFQIFGFSLDNWSALAEALRKHGLENKIVKAVESPFGCRYIVEGKLMSPDGRNPRVRTVWIVEKGESEPRLITAHPV